MMMVVMVVIIMKIYGHAYWNLFPFGESNQGMKLTNHYEELFLHNPIYQ